MRTRSSLLALPLALLSALSAPAQSTAPEVTAVRCGRLVDVKAGAAVPNAVVLISGGRVTDVGVGLAIPPVEILRAATCVRV